MRVVGWLSLLACGCTPILGLHGAQPVPIKNVELQIAGVLQANTGGRSKAAIPVPVIMARVGLGPDIDMGLQVASGLGMDVRYRFYQRGKAHLAITPGFDVSFDPGSSTLITDVRAPLTAEWAVGKNISLIADGRVVVREFWSIYSHPWGPGQINRAEVFIGAGTRFEWHPRRFRLGLGFQIFHQPVDGGKPAMTGGLDMGVRIGKNKRLSQHD